MIQWTVDQKMRKWALLPMCKVMKLERGQNKIKAKDSTWHPNKRICCSFSTSIPCLLGLESWLFGRTKDDVIYLQIGKKLTNVAPEWTLLNLMSLLVNTLVNYNQQISSYHPYLGTLHLLHTPTFPHKFKNIFLHYVFALTISAQ